MDFKAMITNRIETFCEENEETGVAKTCSTEEGFEEIKERVELLLENEFKGQEITIHEVLAWIEANDYEND